MKDFLVALGLVLVIEGLIFAAGPATAKRAMESAIEAPDGVLRMVGLVTAFAGLLVVWFLRG
ncbi:MAG TPA: DUF2065 domain-containing protein [Xanthobacteraceae bacterium]|nr:DUF2065 domain-containing protein [Xanthobacteraceae bacterium]